MAQHGEVGVHAIKERTNFETGTANKLDLLNAYLQPNPVTFRRNSGQWNDSCRYRSYTADASVAFFAQHVSFSRKVDSSRHNGATYVSWSVHFPREREVQLIPEGDVSRNINYFTSGSPVAKRIRDYQQLTYQDINRGIDVLFYYNHSGQFKYDIKVKPGGDILDFELEYSGVESLEVDDAGRLVLHTNQGDYREDRPYSYQLIDGKKREVDVQYKVDGFRLKFTINGSYDPTYELIIDPIYLDWSTYFYRHKSLINNRVTSVEAIDIDRSQNIYIAGNTSEYFPEAKLTYDTVSPKNNSKGFVCKMTPEGDSILYFSYLGTWTYVSEIAVSQDNEPIIAGIAVAKSFPVTPTAYDTNTNVCGYPGNCTRCFVTKFNKTGSALVYSTFFGQTDSLPGGGAVGAINVSTVGLLISALDLNTKGEVHISGRIDRKSSAKIPITSGAYKADRDEMFITKFKSDGSGLVFSTYFGGNKGYISHGAILDLCTDQNNNIYVVGRTNAEDFPITPGSPVFTTKFKPGALSLTGYVAFVSKFSSKGDRLLYSHLLGGVDAYHKSCFESVYVNNRNEVYLAGFTNSADFPVSKNAFQKQINGGFDLMVVKLVSSGTNIAYSTYLGGSGYELYSIGHAHEHVKIVVNDKQQAYVVGISCSTNFPVTPDAYQPKNRSIQYPSHHADNGDLVLTKLSKNGDSVLYSTYFGGDKLDEPLDIKLSRKGCASQLLVCGFTKSSNYPVTSNAFRNQRVVSYGNTSFITKFSDTLGIEHPHLSNQDTIVECDRVFEILNAKNIGATYKWYDGSDEQSKIVVDTGWKWVQVTYGCDTISDSIYFDRQYTPTPGSLGPDSLYCDQFARIDAGNDSIHATYLWQDGATDRIRNLSESGWYSVTVSTSVCGTVNDSVLLKFLETPDIDLGLDSTYCEPFSVKLDAQNESNEVNYLWSSGDSTQTIHVADTGRFWVKVKNSCGDDSSSISLSRLDPPLAKLPQDTVFCDNVRGILKTGDPGNSETYYWSDPDKQLGLGVTDSFQLLDSGAISVTITNACGTSSDTMHIGLLKTPIPALDNHYYLCNEVDTIIDIGQNDNGEQYLWNTGDQTSDLRLTEPGKYWVQIQNLCGVVSDTMEVILKKSPVLNLPSDSLFCDSIDVPIDVSINDSEAEYFLNNDRSGPLIHLPNTGTYRITVRNRCGSISDSISVQLVKTPAPILLDTLVFCDRVTPTQVSPINWSDKWEYVWSNGDTTHSTVLSNHGLTWVHATNKWGTGSDSIYLKLSGSPEINLPVDTSFCNREGIKLGVQDEGMQYEWSPLGETTPMVLIDQRGAYTLSVINTDGCRTSHTIQIARKCNEILWIPSAFSPNNNGLNDVFKINYTQYEDLQWVIFNRWGEIIFQSNHFTKGWDGTYKGTPAPEGSYFYYIVFTDLVDNRLRSLTGSIRLMR